MKQFIAIISFLALLASCGGVNPPVNNITTGGAIQFPENFPQEKKNFVEAFMASFSLENSGELASRGLPGFSNPAASARTTINVASGNGWSKAFTAVTAAGTNGPLEDFPEVGLDTSYTVTEEEQDIYLITVTTSYPPTSLVETYVESYYVQDLDSDNTSSGTGDGIWNEDDPIVALVGGEWVRDPKARKELKVNFRDGSVRQEKIVALRFPAMLNAAGEPVYGYGFTPFLLEGATAEETEQLYAFPEFAMPSEDVNALYSSIVVYTQSHNTNHNFSFWAGVENEVILGVRYYTEHMAGEKLVGTMASYEKTISTLTTNTTNMDLTDIYSGSEHSALAESVMRQSVTFDVSGDYPVAIERVTHMRTHVVDITSEADFQIDLLSSEEAALKAWEDPEGTFIPSGLGIDYQNDDGLITSDWDKVTFDNPDGEPIKMILEHVTGNSDLAVLYEALNTGSYATAFDEVEVPVDDPDLNLLDPAPDPDGDGFL